MTLHDTTFEPDAATCLGVAVPMSPFLNETRIERLNAARYEGQEIRGALSVVRPGDRILELGAGLGVVGAVALKVRKAASLLSFEANPALIPHIRGLYARNDLGDRAEVRNQVLVSDTDRPEALPFHVRNSYLASSLLESNRPTRQVMVPTADFAQTLADHQPDVLLMDIEGGELALLEAVAQGPFRAIVIEFHPEVYGQIGMRACKTHLREAGFQKVEDHCNRRVWTCVRRAMK